MIYYMLCNMHKRKEIRHRLHYTVQTGRIQMPVPLQHNTVDKYPRTTCEHGNHVCAYMCVSSYRYSKVGAIADTGKWAPESPTATANRRK